MLYYTNAEMTLTGGQTEAVHVKHAEEPRTGGGTIEGEVNWKKCSQMENKFKYVGILCKICIKKINDCNDLQISYSNVNPIGENKLIKCL